MPSHYLNQCWDIVNWTRRNKHWNFIWNSYIFIQENAFCQSDSHFVSASMYWDVNVLKKIHLKCLSSEVQVEMSDGVWLDSQHVPGSHKSTHRFCHYLPSKSGHRFHLITSWHGHTFHITGPLYRESINGQGNQIPRGLTFIWRQFDDWKSWPGWGCWVSVH